MSTTALVTVRRFVLDAPIRATLEHGNQALVTFAAAYMSAQFAMQHSILPPEVAIPLAIGFEWTYLRGLATASKTHATGWSTVLNWSAMLTSLIFGVLYILGVFRVIPQAPEGRTAVALALAHVLPITLLSFAAAMVQRQHYQERRADDRLQATAETQRQRELQRAQDALALQMQREREALALEMQRKEHELALWKAARLAKAEVQSTQIAQTPAPQMQANAVQTGVVCPKCGRPINPASAVRIKARGYCQKCKGA